MCYEDTRRRVLVSVCTCALGVRERRVPERPASSLRVQAAARRVRFDLRYEYTSAAPPNALPQYFRRDEYVVYLGLFIYLFICFIFSFIFLTNCLLVI